MSKIPAEIYVKSCKPDIARELLAKSMMQDFAEDGYMSFAGIFIGVFDRSYEVNYALDYIEKHNLSSQLTEFDRR